MDLAGLAHLPSRPTPEGPQITVASGKLAPDTLWLANPDVLGGAQAVASVTHVQGHRAQASATGVQCGMLHLLRGAAVHLCRDTACPALPGSSLASPLPTRPRPQPRPCTAGPRRKVP